MPELTSAQTREAINEIVKEADKAIKAARAVELVLRKKHDDLMLKVQRKGHISEGECKDIEQLGADLEAIYLTIVVLSLETMQRIDASAEVAAIKREIASVNKTLRRQERRLKKIVATSAKTEKATAAILRVVNLLSGFSVKLG